MDLNNVYNRYQGNLIMADDDDSTNQFKDNIQLLNRINKETDTEISKFIDKITIKVKEVLKLSNKFAELHLSLSRSCEWLNKLIQNNLRASENVNDDDNFDVTIFALLEEGRDLSNILQNRLENIKNIFQNLDIVSTSLETASDCIHQSIIQLPKFDFNDLSLKSKNFEKKTKEFEARHIKAKKRSKTPLEQDDMVQYVNNNNNNNNNSNKNNNTIEKNSLMPVVDFPPLKSRGNESSSSTKKRSKAESSLNDIDDTDDEKSDLKSSGKKLRMMDVMSDREKDNDETDDDYEFVDEKNNNNNNNNNNDDYDNDNYNMLFQNTSLKQSTLDTVAGFHDPANSNNDRNDLIDLTI